MDTKDKEHGKIDAYASCSSAHHGFSLLISKLLKSPNELHQSAFLETPDSIKHSFGKLVRETGARSYNITETSEQGQFLPKFPPSIRSRRYWTEGRQKHFRSRENTVCNSQYVNSFSFFWCFKWL